MDVLQSRGAMNRVLFHDSHAYPGCAVSVFPKGALASTGPITACFEDGALAIAQCEVLSESEFTIHVDAYVTRKGTEIGRKSWLIRYVPDQDSWKVMRRLQRQP